MKYTCEITQDLQKELSKSNKQKCIIALIISIVGIFAYIIVPIENLLLEILLYTSSSVFAISLIILLSINKAIKKTSNNKMVGEFELEEKFFNSIAIKDGEQISSVKIYYKDLIKIKETDNYLFLYPNKQIAYPVPKNKLTQDELSLLKGWLNNAKQKKL